MTAYQWLCFLGIDALIGLVFGYFYSLIKKTAKESKATKAGIQALLRAQMINDFNKWSEKGFAPIYARQNFENCWVQYHSLGENGVMDNIREMFFALPT